METHRQFLLDAATRLQDRFSLDGFVGLEAAVKQAIDAGDLFVADVAARFAAELLIDHGHPHEALRRCERALACDHRMDDLQSHVSAITLAINANRLCGREAQAKRLFSRELKRIRTQESLEAELHLTSNYANSLRERWGPEKALFWSARAARLAMRVPSLTSERCSAITAHAAILSELGELREALSWLIRAESLTASGDIEPVVCFFTQIVGQTIYDSLGDPELAELQFFRASTFTGHQDTRPVVQSALLVTRGHAPRNR